MGFGVCGGGYIHIIACLAKIHTRTGHAKILSKVPVIPPGSRASIPMVGQFAITPYSDEKSALKGQISCFPGVYVRSTRSGLSVCSIDIVSQAPRLRFLSALNVSDFCVERRAVSENIQKISYLYSQGFR